MRDQTVTNDFLHYHINKNDMQKVSLTLDNVVSMLPHVKAQLNSKYDVYQICALKSTKIILDCISEVNKILTDFNFKFSQIVFIQYFI